MYQLMASLKCTGSRVLSKVAFSVLYRNRETNQICVDVKFFTIFLMYVHDLDIYIELCFSYNLLHSGVSMKNKS